MAPSVDAGLRQKRGPAARCRAFSAAARVLAVLARQEPTRPIRPCGARRSRRARRDGGCCHPRSGPAPGRCRAPQERRAALPLRIRAQRRLDGRAVSFRHQVAQREPPPGLPRPTRAPRGRPWKRAPARFRAGPRGARRVRGWAARRAAGGQVGVEGNLVETHVRAGQADVRPPLRVDVRSHQARPAHLDARAGEVGSTPRIERAHRRIHPRISIDVDVAGAHAQSNQRGPGPAGHPPRRTFQVCRERAVALLHPGRRREPLRERAGVGDVAAGEIRRR